MMGTSPYCLRLKVLVTCGLCASCAMVGAQQGKAVSRAAAEEFQKQVMAIPPEQQGILAERNAAGAVRGLLDELSTPERQAQVARALESTLASALRGVADNA